MSPPVGSGVSTFVGDRRVRVAAGCAAYLGLIHLFWPLRPGVIAQGVIIGGLTALIAFGITFIYRANRIVNFAQGDLGALPAALAVLLIVGPGWPFGLAVPVGIAAAIVLGIIVERLVIRRFAKAPRLILTVATIGLAQVLAALGVALPQAFDLTVPPQSYPSPIDVSFTIDPITFSGNDLMAVIVIPIVLVGLVGLLRYTDLGIAIRATAESRDRASLLGVPVGRISLIVWVLTTVLATIALVLRAGIVGLPIGSVLGPSILLRALAAAVIGRMEKLGTTLAAAIGLGILETAIVFRSDPFLVDAMTFVVLMGAIAFQHRDRLIRFTEASTWRAVAEVRPIPPELANLSIVRWGRRVVAALVLAVAVCAPLIFDEGDTNLAARLLILGMVGVSLVVLSGWAGQVSLGQVAFLGVGAAVGGYVTTELGLDLSFGLLASGLIGAAVAIVIGIPALRVRGLLLAVATFAFAQAVSTWLLNPEFQSWLPTDRIPRKPLFGRLVLESETRYYYLVLAVLIAIIAMARALRSGRTGRVLIATRENERAAQSFGVSVTRAKLTAFAFSGFFAALGGGLFVHHQQSLGVSAYAPERSLEAFAIVVIGGLGSIPGALLGSVYLESFQWTRNWWPEGLRPLASLLGGGVGVLVILMVLPGGLGSLVYRVRDALLRRIARSRDIHVPSLVADSGEREASATPAGDETAPIKAVAKRKGQPILEVSGLEVSYDQTQVLFGVDLVIEPGEIVALLGTNGAGKSTVLRAISGLVDARAGAIRIDGTDVTGRAAHLIASMGVVQSPGGGGVFPSLTVRENLRVATWLLRGSDEAEEATKRVLEIFTELSGRLEQAAGSLSGGEQQMLTLGMSLIDPPKVLMIDELSLGLAPTVVQRLLKVVELINARGTAVVLVEQSVNVALTVADRAYFLEKGEVRFEGRTADLLGRRDVLRSVFLEGAAGRSNGGRRRASARANGKRAKGAEPALRAQDLHRSFGGLVAVDEISVAAWPGEIVGIIGPNGAGKTTLFDLMSGFLPIERGHISLNGDDVTELTADARALIGLARSFQDARLFPGLTVEEAIAVGLDREVGVKDPLVISLGLDSAATSERETKERVDELVELMGLDAFRNKFIAELSTGTRRIVDLACVLGHRPTVILFDEPSSGIAQREAEALAPLLSRIRDDTGAALIVIEHDIPLVTSISNRMVALDLGRVIAEGSPRDVVRDPAVVTSYLGTNDAAITRSGKRSGRATRARRSTAKRKPRKRVRT